MIKCRNIASEIIASELTLPSIISCKGVVERLDRIVRCDKGGFHIYLLNEEKKK